MSTPKILIVDDEPNMLKVTELSLRRGGYELIVGCNGLEAIELAEREQPSLIVMDVLMPELDGLGALRLLKQSPKTAPIPVILLTGRGHNLTQQDAEGSGASLLLTKPFSPKQLLTEAIRLINAQAPPPPTP